MNAKVISLNDEINKVVRGKQETVKKVLAAIFAGGHILLEDIPGVGKTTLALAISKVLNLKYRRVQFTPDVLPSDITGFSMYNAKTGEFEYREGAAMTNLLLADEINRTSPKTQSALLEIMEEGSVTVDGITHKLPEPFIVIATENPIGSSGTQMLPESQLDRFMMCTSLGYPDHSNATDILKNNIPELLRRVPAVMDRDELSSVRSAVSQVYARDTIYEYIVTLTEKTRNDELFSLGASPRASVALLAMARAVAYMDGRDYVVPRDVTSVICEVYGHRVKVSREARAQGIDSNEALLRLTAEVPLPDTTSAKGVRQKHG